MRFKSWTTGKLVIGLVLLGTTLTPASDLAFSQINLGEPVPDLRLTRVGGGVESYLGLEDGLVSVFAFVKSDHQRSENLILQWSRLQTDFADQPVHWTLIISDRHDTGEFAHWDSLAPGATVLMDSGDQLYSQLGVVLTPTVGIADKNGLLQAYIPFRQINYPTTIKTHLKHVLGQISQEQMHQLLNPSGRAVDSLQAGAKRKLKLGRMLLNRGRVNSALAQVEDALSSFPDLPEGYLLLAEVLRATDRNEEAARAEAMAVQLSDSSTDTISASTGDK